MKQHKLVVMAIIIIALTWLSGCGSGGSTTGANYTGVGTGGGGEEPATGSVTGIVTDAASGNPLQGAQVIVDSLIAITDSSGSYTINNVTAGQAKTIVCQCSGYGNNSQTIDVTSGGTTTCNFTMSAVLPDSGTVQGTVTDSATGNRLQGVVVIVGSIAAITDSGGFYTLNGVPTRAEQTITAQCTGYQDYSDTVDVTSGVTTTHNFTMEKLTGTVTGIVTDATDSPLQGVMVIIGSLVSTTGAAGDYTLENVPVGAQVITAQLSGYQNYSGLVDVSAGETTTHNITMTVVAPTSGTVTGVVTTDDVPSQAIQGAVVVIGALATITDADGKYTINGVPAGLQTITALCAGFQNYSDTVDVDAGGPTTCDFSMSWAIWSVKGTLKSKDAPVIGALVSVGSYFTHTDLSGDYSLADLPLSGSHTVSAEIGRVIYTRDVTPSPGHSITCDFTVDWIITTVQSGGDDGIWISLALDSSGYPRISSCCYNGIHGDLQYIQGNGTTWNIETVEEGETGAFTGPDNSLALNSAGNPCISYYYQTSQELKYARWNGTAWDIETVDGGGNHTSLALDSSEYPHISHSDGSNLRYARWNGASWDIETVDSGGYYTSLVLDSAGNPHISYSDGSNLKYAQWNGAWVIKTVGSERANDASLALDSQGYPHISYYDGSNGNLKYARWNGTAWAIETVDSAGTSDTWANVSLALDSSGYPHISYYYQTGSELKYARWNGASWDIETVDSGVGYVGQKSSLALDSAGNPHISYRYYHDLKYCYFGLLPMTP